MRSRGSSLTKQRTPLGPHRRPMPRVLEGPSRGVGVFLWARYPCTENSLHVAPYSHGYHSPPRPRHSPDAASSSPPPSPPPSAPPPSSPPPPSAASPAASTAPPASAAAASSPLPPDAAERGGGEEGGGADGGGEVLVAEEKPAEEGTPAEEVFTTRQSRVIARMFRGLRNLGASKRGWPHSFDRSSICPVFFVISSTLPGEE